MKDFKFNPVMQVVHYTFEKSANVNLENGFLNSIKEICEGVSGINFKLICGNTLSYN
ncbi:hypothetical protein [Brumimicrobium glaciale]|uniref:hypothetical protein n=1 Tax=Brumimicrobium glaciale TaxID=200475 RepID=UPI0013ECB2C3|nr:hypothetical protein [Brumimicrobium glaciale]